MRILVLTPGAYGVNGGIALYNRDIVEALADMPGVVEIVVVPQEIQRDYADVPGNVRIRRAAAGGRRHFVQAALAELRSGYDLIVCGHVFLMPLAILLTLRWRAPLALMVYGIDVWVQIKRLSRLCVRRADAVWSISEVTTQRMQSWARLPAGRYVQLPNAIRLEDYGESGDPATVRRRHGLEGRKVLMTLARLPGFDRYKGVDEVLECLPELQADDPSLAYLVVGDGEDRQRLEEKARSLGVADSVKFAGYVAEAEKPDHYRAADLFVMPGRGEGFGFVFLEALACGVPCVGSALDGSREALREGMLGEIPDPRNRDELLAAIRKGLSAKRGIPQGLSYFAWPQFRDRVQTAAMALTMRGRG